MTTVLTTDFRVASEHIVSRALSTTPISEASPWLRRWVNFAIELARESLNSEHRVGAVLLDGNLPLASSTNLYKTHPKQKLYNIKAKRYPFLDNLHAEMQCLVESGHRDLAGTEIVVARLTPANNVAMSRPCDACWRALYDSGVKVAHYIWWSSQEPVGAYADEAGVLPKRAWLMPPDNVVQLRRAA